MRKNDYAKPIRFRYSEHSRLATAGAIDRFVHHSVTLELNIPSYRMDAAKKTRDPALETGE